MLGAGIVGVSAAYAARQRGLSVVLVDRREPGNETSYGNAGILSSGSISPLNNPSLWNALPKYLTNTHAALRWDVGWAMRNPDWMPLSCQCGGLAYRPRATALHGLIGASLKLHRDWIVKAGAAERIRETGWLKAWRSDTVAAAKAEQAMLTEYGIKSELLDRQAISALEPNIVPVYKVGLLHTQTASVNSPGNVVKAYAKMLAGAGGEIRQSEIKSIVPDGEGWRVQLADGAIAARHVVVALGPWSADILRPLGYRVPLAFERGYHREYKPNPARTLQRPIHDADGSFPDDADGERHPRHLGRRTDRPRCAVVLCPDRRGGADGARCRRIRRGRRRNLARVAADAARQPADDRAGAAASRSVACLRQPAYRLHHGACDGCRDRRHDRRRAAVFRCDGVCTEPLPLM